MNLIGIITFCILSAPLATASVTPVVAQEPLSTPAYATVAAIGAVVSAQAGRMAADLVKQYGTKITEPAIKWLKVMSREMNVLFIFQVLEKFGGYQMTAKRTVVDRVALATGLLSVAFAGALLLGNKAEILMPWGVAEFSTRFARMEMYKHLLDYFTKPKRN